MTVASSESSAQIYRLVESGPSRLLSQEGNLRASDRRRSNSGLIYCEGMPKPEKAGVCTAIQREAQKILDDYLNSQGIKNNPYDEFETGGCLKYNDEAVCLDHEAEDEDRIDELRNSDRTAPHPSTPPPKRR